MALAVLAFRGLTQKDVKIVEFASYWRDVEGIVNNDATPLARRLPGLRANWKVRRAASSGRHCRTRTRPAGPVSRK